MGLICVSSAETGEPLALWTRARSPRCAPAPWRRSPRRSSRARTATVGILGCGLHGAWAARAWPRPSTARAWLRPRPRHGRRLAGELGWEAGRARTPSLRRRHLRHAGRRAGGPRGDLRPGCTCHARRRRPGQGRGRVEAVDALRAVLRRVGPGIHGGELTGAVGRAVARDDVAELGEVLTGAAAGAPPRRDHAVRLHGPGDPGPRDLPRRRSRRPRRCRPCASQPADGGYRRRRFGQMSVYPDTVLETVAPPSSGSPCCSGVLGTKSRAVRFAKLGLVAGAGLGMALMFLLIRGALHRRRLHHAVLRQEHGAGPALGGHSG